MAGKVVVVLGGGVGGVVAANRLRRLLGREHRIIIVDRSPWHSFAPSYLWVTVGQRDPSRITRDLRSLARKGIEFRISEITTLDLANKKVGLEEQELAYDYLVVALGAQYSSHQIPGLNKAWTYYHLEGAEGLRDELSRFEGGRLAIVVSGLPYKCPAAPYEGALILDEQLRGRGIRADVDIQVFTPEPHPLPVAGPAVGQMVIDLLASRQITFNGGVRLKSVDQAARKLAFEGGEEVAFDLLVATPVHSVPGVLAEAGMAEEDGWVMVDRETLATPFPDVYAVGDVTAIPLANGMMLPKAGVFAHGEAEVVARNIAAEIEGGQPDWAFGGQGACFLETGFGKAAFAEGNFFAEPDPKVALRGPSRFRRWQKVGFERTWLWRWF
jgi:sulfide:quinone oxidoreductase